ncbi:MAG: signal peptidase I [Clostridia bacterium]|nr:signal peptidase I [Clostridia bacterium]
MSEAKTDVKNWKKTLKIVLNVVLWLFVAFAVVVTVLAFAAQRSADGVPTINGKCYLTVLSDSMSPTFKKGDLLIAKKLSGPQKAELKVGDVISYFGVDLNLDGKIEGANEENAIKSHRIIEVVYDANGAVESYITQGDNRDVSVTPDAPVKWQFVIAKYTGTRVRGLGGFLNFLQQPKGFLIVIVLPLVAFFLYEVFVFIKTFLGIKNEGKKVISTADEELIKQRAVEEYLKQQAAEQAAKQAEAPPEQDDQPKE